MLNSGVDEPENKAPQLVLLDVEEDDEAEGADFARSSMANNESGQQQRNGPTLVSQSRMDVEVREYNRIFNEVNRLFLCSHMVGETMGRAI